jgi:hypothetical protein
VTGIPTAHTPIAVRNIVVLATASTAAEPVSFKPGAAAQDSSHRPCLNAPSVIDHGGGHVDGKIALEEHLNFPEFRLPRYVNPHAMKAISRRLLDVSTMRLEETDASGIDYSLQALNAPGVQGEPDPGTHAMPLMISGLFDRFPGSTSACGKTALAI